MILYLLYGYLILFHFIFPIAYLIYFSSDRSIDPNDHIYYKPKDYTYENVLQRMLDIERVLKIDLKTEKNRLLFYHKNAVRTRRDLEEYEYLIEPGFEAILLRDEKMYKTAWKDIDIPLRAYISIITLIWLPLPTLFLLFICLTELNNFLGFIILLAIGFLFLVLFSFLLVFVQLKIFSSYVSIFRMIRKSNGKDIGQISRLHLNMQAISHFFMATRFLGKRNSYSISSSGFAMGVGGFGGGGFGGGGFGGFGGGSSGGGGAGGSW